MAKKNFGFAGYLFIFCVLLFLDFMLKRYVHQNIPVMSWATPTFPFGGIGVFDSFFGFNFAICHVQNMGCAWGMFSQFSELLFFVRIILIMALVVYIVFLNQEKGKTLPLFLILTGAIGNIVDFFVYGKVIDMFFFYWKSYSFPVFNIADSLITIGISILIIQSIYQSLFKNKVGHGKNAH